LKLTSQLQRKGGSGGASGKCGRRSFSANRRWATWSLKSRDSAAYFFALHTNRFLSTILPLDSISEICGGPHSFVCYLYIQLRIMDSFPESLGEVQLSGGPLGHHRVPLPNSSSARSCLHCRSRRRMCDRTLPSCIECQGYVYHHLFNSKIGFDCKAHYRTNSNLYRVGRICQYKSLPSKSKPQDSKESRRQGTVPRIVPAAAVRPKPLCNTGQFLATPRKFSTLQIDLPVPHGLFQILSPSIIHNTQTVYFRSFHPGLPIVSKRLLLADLSNAATEPRADLTLLLLCMKLLTDLPDPASTDGMRTPAYLAAKRLLRSIESAERYSTRFLQAGLLIAMYELGHAIYPEALASVSRNAKLGLALGIHDFKSDRMNPSPMSWTESEERTRTWWGIMIVDRYA
jgi:Fungal specific transcription factor domain/Fungal Zn(2)-Cys(6) binuclear cluster domain